ncbi:MAG TPA: SIMPL domain-containing protein [Nevskiaceae bacterium]|nr:SIMPL domain-containing protein [Nevskiaceae bacterium]
MEIRKVGIAGLVAVLMAGAASAHDDSIALHRHVSVTGHGEITAKPDRARLHLGVTKLDLDLRAAEAGVNGVVRAYLAEAKALGIKDEHISTAGMNIAPEYVWDEKERNNRLVGYRASREIDLVIENLDKIGDFVLRATKVGVNQVQTPQLESSKAKELQSQAMVKAAEEARAKAKLLAETLGAKLGPIHNLSVSDGGMPPPMPKMMAMRAAAADSGNEEMGFSAGEIRFNVQVSADFELLVP